MKNWKLLFLAVVVCWGWRAPAAHADDYVIYVAPKDSAALTAAQGKENGTSIFAERTLHKALTQAAELLSRPGRQSVRVLVAQGQYTGKIGGGVWVIPPVANPQGSLYIIGGLNDDWSGRQPFGNLTELVTNRGRNGALLQFENKSRLQEVVISGFLFDAGPSNDYDSKSNSIKKGTSRTYPLLSFAMLMTDHLVVADNIFLNGAHGAFDPYIIPASAEATVDINNNFFINNIKAVKASALFNKDTVVRAINFRHNSFLLNWPYNPDPTSSLVSAIELYHKGGAQSVNFENNIFAFNPGGALQHDWTEDRMPRLALRNNLFFMNAALFGKSDEDAGVFVGKFGLNPRYLVVGLENTEDDFNYTMQNNVAFDPKIPLAMAPLKAADSSSVQRENTILNDVRRIFGMNQSGGKVAIANYAPRLVYDPKNLPFPKEERARAYGVQPDKLWTFGNNAD